MSARTHPSELRDAARFVPEADVAEFVRRARDSRLRVSLLEGFYLRFPCRMSALHLLGAGSIAMARFAAISEVYAQIGDRLLPVDRQGQPRTEAWVDYIQAFEQGFPADVIEEHWLRAHLADMELVKAEGWVQAFDDEKDRFAGDPMWALLDDHMKVTLGTRLADGEALAGEVALETAIARSLTAVVVKATRRTFGIMRVVMGAAVRGVLLGGPWVPPHLPSDRGLVWSLCRSTLMTLRMRRVVSLGFRRRSRGALPPGGAWSLLPSLEQALGAETEALDPLVLQFFDRMSDFEMTASVHLYHRAGRWAAWFATLLVGQGMYEEDLEEVDARFQLFRRDDGSMHFVREFWCADEVRVFDSDFVLRTVDGAPTLLEVFQDIHVAAQMHTTVMSDGGLSMTVCRVYVRGIPLSPGPFRVCFETRPENGGLNVAGTLDLEPGGVIAWMLSKMLPARIGEIRYRATERVDA